MGLSSEVIAVERLGSADRAAMLDLMQRHYDGVRPDRFFDDLGRKHSVILVREPRQGSLCGFSTQALIELDKEDNRVALFSGDTIVDRRYWGDPALGQAWGRFALQLIEDRTDVACEWFLISQGFRTYRYLSLFFREFYPRYDQPMPPVARERITRLATHLFGEQFDSERLVVRAAADGYRLRGELAAAGNRAAADPHVAYFLQQNPGHVYGDELCCLAPLTRENFTPAAWRVINRPNLVDVA